MNKGMAAEQGRYLMGASQNMKVLWMSNKVG